MSKNVLILGKGAFGSAIGHCINKEHKLFFYTRNEYSYKVGRNVNLTSSLLDEIFNDHKIDIIFICLPSKEIITTINLVSKWINKPTIIVNCSKGLSTTGNSFYDEFKKINPNFIYTALNGPSFASEILENALTQVDIFSESNETFNFIESLFEGSILKLNFIINNFKCSELVSSLKNATALGMGLVHKLTNFKNTINAIYTMVLKEVKKIVEFELNQKIDLIELFGIGDYTMCCFDKESRNFNYGYNLFDSNDENITIEGKRTIGLINEKYKELDLKFFSYLDDILNKKLKPEDFINKLFSI